MSDRPTPLTLCVAASLAMVPGSGWTKDGCEDDAMIVFDGSGSMSEMGFNTLDEPRIFEARRAMRQIMPKVEDFRKIGLITYGPSRADSCEGIELRFPPREKSAYPVITTVESLEPSGETPLTEAVGQAVKVLTDQSAQGTVVLVTDGKETCGGAPCQLAALLAADWPGVTVHVIGYKVRGDQFSWPGGGASDYTEATSVAQCLAEQTGGLYIGAESAEELVGALQRTLGCPLFSEVMPARLTPIPFGQ